MPPITKIRLSNTCRLIPSRYPPVGILDAVAKPEDLELVFELEGWTNDRMSAELGILWRLPPAEWVLGRPMASVIMAAFCHPRPEGSRFNGPDRGAWYAAFSLSTAHAEAIFHRAEELAEIGISDTRVEMRQYLADFDAAFHDIREVIPENEQYHSPHNHKASQKLAQELLDIGSNGVLYRSVRQARGECIACFRPPLVTNVRPGAHFEYRWQGMRDPKIRKLQKSA
jgi:hypothetical protein